MSVRGLVAAALLACAGCAATPQPLKTYAGPELPAHAVAQIVGEMGPSGGVFIVCMDGVSLERRWGAYDNDARWPDKLAVIPGRHSLAAVYSLRVGQRAWWSNVELSVEAGRRYLVKGEAAQMWVIDESANGAVVATAVPRTARLRPVDPCP